MAPRFDGENFALELAVADLLDARLQKSLGFANRGGYERMWLGQAIHSRYQEEALAADPTYRREVALATTLSHRGWEVTIQGRADGLRRSGEGVVVEEIKSVRRDGSLSAAARQMYEQQARLYAWMLAREGQAEVAAELVLIEIGSDVVDREPVALELGRLERGVKQRLDALLREYEQKHAALAGRRGAAERLAFPYDAVRPGQPEIVAAIERALGEEGHLLVEAPTGIGKTVAALYPALKFALEHDKRVFVLTAKTLQQTMATSVLELLNREDAFHSLQLRAKAKMCANDEIICHEEYCPFARDYFAKLHSSQVVRRIRDTHTTVLPDDVFEASRLAEVCPFEVSLELSREAQVVVCDYNYAFAPYVGLTDFSGENDLSDVVLIVDEIHNLVERGRGYFSPSLAAAATRQVAAAMVGGAPIERRIVALAHRLTALVETTVAAALEEAGGRARAAETALPEDDLFALRVDFDEVFIDYLEHRRETSTFRANDLFVALYFDLLRFLNGLVLAQGPAFSKYAERGADGAALHVLCKDPSRQLGALINRTHSVIGLSATLSPIEFYRDLLGFDRERFAHLTLPSPFPSDNRRLVIDDTVATTWRRRPDNYAPIARRLGELASRVPGNCLALFPSYQFLAEVGRHLQVPGKRVLIQSRADGDRERELLLDALRSSLAGDVLLLAVAGGVFAEGVDYPGDMLKAVAVIGPCLPGVSLERELLKRYYDEQFERGFEYAFVVPGMTRVVQAAGRLIRSAEDTGVVALLDERFLANPYRHYLPADWGQAEQLVGSPGSAAEEFFGSRVS
ncbi:MAG: DEAD/DEAH box helicase [Acidobacteriota bacterium]|nr:DEAD/DEAH box helicase [Acidobacteriota bacterium]MDH3522611.1 DEAD/DEAH box helicase [Acidobacteriota bacterium]